MAQLDAESEISGIVISDGLRVHTGAGRDVSPITLERPPSLLAGRLTEASGCGPKPP